MKGKKSILIFLFVFLTTFAIVLGVKLSNKPSEVVAENDTTNQEVYEVNSYITDDIKANVQKCGVDLFFEKEYTPEIIGNDADDIVIASVISLDGVTANAGLFGMTTGKLLIHKTLKGDLEQGQVVEYMKNGGVMKMSEWEKTQPENANAKRQYLREKSGENLNTDEIYINILISDDIEIEEGYTYLIYLKENASRYEIIGLGAGLRKVDMDYSETVSVQDLDISTLRIMNNKTGEFESLQEYVNDYIKTSDK